jgi:hypothetical protein
MSARQQVRVPRPPEGDDGPRGSRAGVLASYRHDIVRVVTAGGTVDIVPNHGADVAEPPGALSQVDRGVDDVGPVHVIPASHAPGEPTTARQDARATRKLHQALDQRGWAWDRAVIFAPGREWVQTAAAVRAVPLHDVLHLARDRGHEAVHTWFDGLLVITPTGLGPDLLAPVVVRARLRPADVGCPMRFGDADRVCVRDGGPFTGSSMRAALVWEHHRAMLVAALGCSICAGGNVATQGRPYGITDMVTPSRRGGWAWGAPRDDLVDPVRRPARRRTERARDRALLDDSVPAADGRLDPAPVEALPPLT